MRGQDDEFITTLAAANFSNHILLTHGAAHAVGHRKPPAFLIRMGRPRLSGQLLIFPPGVQPRRKRRTSRSRWQPNIYRSSLVPLILKAYGSWPRSCARHDSAVPF